ncbi:MULTISPECIES: sulfurtransferase TusA family protein [Actinomycetes]|uniref:sulfurtransferase TusA family protein n=1 Tax=Actinomycetes TaxID=1760 RepID=UPI0009DE806E|nr:MULTISPECIES: sulfurtransferase TusA family protein [Actinomycetes]
MSATQGPRIDHLDGSDLSCARLLILLRNQAAQVPPGTVIHLTTTDPVAPIDLPAWCRMTGHTYLGPIDGPGTPTYAVRTSGTPMATDPARPWHVTR